MMNYEQVHQVRDTEIARSVLEGSYSVSQKYVKTILSDPMPQVLDLKGFQKMKREKISDF